VNTLAQTAGAYCLTREGYRQKTLKLIAKERLRLSQGLSAIAGLSVFPAQANYLLVRMDRRLQPASSLKSAIFRRDRILIRDCGSFDGLDDWYFRVAVRLPDQNDRLIAAIRNSI
jgi:threonine-phosphate decarboxylase